MEAEGLVLLIFHEQVTLQAIRKLLGGFGTSFLAWEQAFEGNEHVFGVKVKADRLADWARTLSQLPEVSLALTVKAVAIVPNHEV